MVEFAVHHLSLGADHLWLHLDTPSDDVVDKLGHLANVTIIQCDTPYWNQLGGRPDEHQLRQVMNMQRVYNNTVVDWVAHIDVDEFIVGDDISSVLADHDGALMVRMKPWEALFSPHDGSCFNAHLFRTALRGDTAKQRRRQSFQEYTPLLPKGALSHTAGKAFFRTGTGLSPRIHSARLNHAPLDPVPFEDRLQLLHFHAQNRTNWLAHLPYRLEHGAYRANPKLSAFLKDASDDEVKDFYNQVMRIKPWLRDKLIAEGLMIDIDLHLALKVDAVMRP
ncbi:hypothetical protein BVC71_06435 [Marivivens niveibacter]|uniref:Glycosyl transferase family 2 n=1 Tax=Marivivens niveibacter TaxID=1930667 RepID=A0A251WZI8_9RHOB|nr:glycosyltransferase family 2 protein [Marivivens niveibacter]OUD09484.1 hypothetical protein BVC71_06435 [Marivivens niveibacter]